LRWTRSSTLYQTRHAGPWSTGSGAGPATVSELSEPFDMALPSFMKHMRVLEESGLVSSSKSGRVRTCTLERDKFAAAERWFEQQRALWSSRYDNLDTFGTTARRTQWQLSFSLIL
jgi:DNA-binding transcriptional ArsR family regulator